MASVTQLGYVGLSVNNVEEWEHFATDVLGLQSNGIDSEGNLSLRMDEYSHRFIIQPTGKDDLDFVGWQVTDEPALRQMAFGTGTRRTESFNIWRERNGQRNATWICGT